MADEDMPDELIADVVGGSGSTVVRVDDVTEAALTLADALSAELIEGDAAFTELLEQRRRELAERVAAHAALELKGRDASACDEPSTFVNDIAGLRSLVERLDAADALVAAACDDARKRAGAASGLAVHPTAIRNAAADVLDARATVMEQELAIERLDSDEPDAGGDESGVHATDVDVDVGDASDEREQRRGLHLTDVDEVKRIGLIAAAALVVGVVLTVVSGSPLALVIPGVAVCWLVVTIVRQRDGAYDEEIASRNLENVARLTDRAYGGAGLAPPVDEAAGQERLALEKALAGARDRLAYAEGSWRSLVGPDADVDDVESVVRSRDAQYGVSDAMVAELPSYRAAAAHRRRLHAQWKVAWWALDRPVPSLEGAAAAIDALEADGIDEITIRPRAEGALTDAEQERLAELAAGRSEDELRSTAERSFPPAVVVDDDGAISEERLRDETAQLPDDVRFVVVAPAG